MASQFWPTGANIKMEACAFVYSFTDPNEHLGHAQFVKSTLLYGQCHLGACRVASETASKQVNTWADQYRLEEKCHGKYTCVTRRNK